MERRQFLKFSCGVCAGMALSAMGLSAGPVLAFAQEASKAIAAVQLESLDQRKKAELAEAEALVSISKDTGVTIGDLIELRPGQVTSFRERSLSANCSADADRPRSTRRRPST